MNRTYVFRNSEDALAVMRILFDAAIDFTAFRSGFQVQVSFPEEQHEFVAHLAAIGGVEI
jgi:hypothetical protein